MDMSQMLPMLMMMMNKDKTKTAADANAESPDFEKVMENLNKNGGNPMDLLGNMQGGNPEMMRMFKLFSEMNSKDRKGGVPTDLLFEMMGGGNPQFKQMKMMMDMFGQMNKKSQKGTSGVTTASAEPLSINELKPIKSIAPDAIHRSMQDYLKKRGTANSGD
jgi:hypothetical protein